jgi:hypothetical protein
LADANKFDEAVELCGNAEKALIKLKDAEGVLRLRERKKELEVLKKEYGKVKDADARLAVDGDDAEANLVMGRFYAFQKGDWTKAIPMLAKGGDPFLKLLAEGETKAASTLNGAEKLGIGTAWWNGSLDAEAKMLTGSTSTCKVSVDKETLKKAKGALKSRGVHWFIEAWPLLEDADRNKLRPRFRDYDSNVAASPDRKGDPEGWTHWNIGSTCDRSATYARSGRYSLHTASNPKGELNLKMVTKVRLIAGKKYTLSCWALTTGDAHGNVELQGPDGNGGLYTVGVRILPDRPYWSRFQTEFEPAKGVSEMNFRLVMDGKNSQLWLDDVSLVCEGKEVLANGGFENPK